MQIVWKNKEIDWKRKEKDFDWEIKQRQKKAKGHTDTLWLQFTEYTMLTWSRSNILAAVKGTSLIKFPKKADKSMGRKMDAFYQFHSTQCHFTDKCQDLKN